MIRTLAYFSLAVISLVAARPTIQKCSIEPADIVFVVDTSTSIWSVDFERYVRPFVQDVVKVFNIGPGEEQSRVGMVTFGDRYHHEFYLKDYLDKESLLTRIESTKQRGGNTKTNLAIDYMRTELFAPGNGARDYATQIVIILTDGRSDDTSLTKVAAQKARNEGIELYAIGVGYRVGITELKDIASDPDSKHMFYASHFQVLDSIKDQLINHTCGATPAPTTSTTVSTTQTSTTEKPTTTTTEAPTTPTTTQSSTTTTTEPSTTTTTTTTTEPTTTTTTTTTEPTTTTTTTTTTEPTTTTTTTTTTKPTTSTTPTTTTELTTTTEKPQKEQPNPEKLNCKTTPADIFFVLDVSSSLYIKDFNEKVLPFVSSVLNDFEVSPDHTRVGIVTFSKGVTPVFGLDEYLSSEEVEKAISPSNIVYEGGRRTDTAEAIAYVRDIGFASGVSRKGVTKMVVIITDGQSYDQALTAKEAKAAKKVGLTTFTIGVGLQIDMNEMRAIASEPEEEFVYHVSDFDALAGVQDFLRDAACKVKDENPVTTPEECLLGPADIMFVFESASKQPTSRRIMNTLITDFAENLKIKAKDVRVGSLTDPCPSEEDMNALTLKDFQQKLQTIVRNTEGQMYRLLKTLRTEHFSSTSSRHEVAVLFMDEQTRNPAMTVREARRLKQAGVEVYVVAVGDVVDYMVYEAVSEPEKSHVIRAKNYSHLESMKLTKLWNVCSEARVPKKPFVFKRKPM